MMLKKFLSRKKEDLPVADGQSEDAVNGIEPHQRIPLSEQINDVNVEAGLPLDSSSGKSNMAKVAVLAVALVGVGIAVSGMIAFSGGGDEEAGSNPQELEKVGNTQQKDFSTEKLDFGRETAAGETAASQLKAAEDVPPVQLTENTQPEQSAAPVQEAAAETPQDRKMRGEVLVDENKGGRLAGQTQTGGTEPSGSLQSVSFADSGRESSQNNLASRLNPTDTPSAQVRRRADLTYLLAKGTHIPCILDTQIITTHAGLTRCLVTKDVYSANGKVLLLERGTKITGEQNSALLQGQARVFVLWNEAKTPKGVKVSLASGGAGQLGASGHEARVNYHFWQRFGGAVMISLIGDLGDFYKNRTQGSGQSISFENSSAAAQEMATEALKNSINIPPTGFINHGTLINIMVARDVDFSSVYEVVSPYEMF